ncbi:MAG TPA: pseudouridine synthase [Candidatus Acidoferrum sp.]|nr:pseudouridine synthase [Candidatus Acidoferrum sp.]
MQERLQKIMAACGIASRRACEEMIAAGRVKVNGATVRELGTKADASDVICVDGKPLAAPERLVYFVLNKPKGYVTTVSDPQGRPTVMDLMRNHAAVRTSAGLHSAGRARVYPVGRLDYASEGLLLMTNDGTLAQRLTKAGAHVRKTYLVKVSGKPKEEDIERLRAGVKIELQDGRRVKTSPAKIRLAEDGANPWYEVILIEGRNRQIRRMFEKIGHPVEKIRRVQIGPLKLDVEVGKFRGLSAREVKELKEAMR